MLTSRDIRQRFLDFFAKRGHTIIPSASLVTPDEKGATNSTLFNTAGMQPLVPYLLGKAHESGAQRLVNSQKCLRTVDIEDVGDNTHATFFEMLGNWSLGDYFKKEAIQWSFEFLTSKEEGLGLDLDRLYVTVFAGDTNAPRDTESAEIWKKVGVPENRIYFKDAASNWWPAVKPGKKENWTGPTGPCSEMFYDVTEKGLGNLSPEECQKAEDEQKIVEIWNDVFMEFEKKDGEIVGRLAQKNVDTGAGLERLTAVLQHVNSIYDTDLLRPLMDTIEKEAKSFALISGRIIADHIRTATFLISDGVTPSNTDRGYILRRIIRRAYMHGKKIDLPHAAYKTLIQKVCDIYEGVYEKLNVGEEFEKEIKQFEQTLEAGLKVFEKILHGGAKSVSAADAFLLFTSYGLPIELISELAATKSLSVDTAGFEEEFKKHQALSRAGAEQKFKGGLANTNEKTVKLHTAHHLLLAALQRVLGSDIHQRGSNITEERLRIDFSFDRKVTKEELQKVGELVEDWINQDLDVIHREMPKEEAVQLGAEMEFGAKYPDLVSIYTIQDKAGNYISKEFCGGPHVKKTGELGHFKIAKEEAVSAGVRRIKATLA